MLYAGAAERMMARDRRAGDGRHARRIRASAGSFSTGRSRSTRRSGISTASRRRSSASSGFFRHAAQGLEERKQILYLLGPVGGGKSSLAERLKELMERGPVYVLKAGDEVSPVFESPLGLFDPMTMGADARGEIRHPAAQAHRPDEPVGGQAARRVRRRHLQVLGGQALSVAAAADVRRQDRARRREQPGHLGAGRQGRYPQARVPRPERRRRLLLLGRPQPHDAGPARVRRDVQGADQDAAPAADRDAGRAPTSAPRTSERCPIRASSSPTRTRASGRASARTRTTRRSSTASA